LWGITTRRIGFEEFENQKKRSTFRTMKHKGESRNDVCLESSMSLREEQKLDLSERIPYKKFLNSTFLPTASMQEDLTAASRT
jgi:hypothetical protein